MDGASSVWAVLLPVVIGGALTLVGPMVHEWWSHRRIAEKQRSEDLRSLLASLYEHDHWLDVKRRSKTMGSPETEGPNPLSKAFTLCCLEFPELLKDLQMLEAASRGYEQWMAQAAIHRLAGRFDRINEGLVEPYKEYINTFAALRGIISDYARPKPLNLPNWLRRGR